MTTQPEALALADILDLHAHYALNGEAFNAAIAAAAELRRQHEVNQELLATLKEMLDGEGKSFRELCEQARAAINKAERTTT